MLKLQNGVVTQNETWISYKTKSGTKSLAKLQEFANELAAFLKENKIEHEVGFNVEYAENSVSRNYSATIMVISKCQNKQIIPYAANAID